ncbi:MAG: PLDc N-terminal domain-containing protein [Mesorhizobium sp.]|nr:phospholipase D-like domain-containing protein [Mesorhizobium sp.]MBN9242657.1 PLDc N-terminal domain-containing protein [Mesorhizobium sp.]
MATLLTIAHLLLFAAVTLRVLARSDMLPTTRVAWILVLLILPAFGVLLYVFVGEISFRGPARAAHRAAEAETGPSVAASGERPSLERYGVASGFATSINGFGPTEGNRGELLDSPAGARARMIEDFDNARHSISVLYYIWLDDGTGRAVAEALMRAARRGVRCKAMVDAIGSRAFIKSETWAALQAAGVKTAVALPLGNPIVTMFQRRLDLRNHRKITVIDNAVLHCGSQNCADAEFRVKPKFAPWVDIMMRLEGPVVRQMHLLLAQDWLCCHPGELAHFDAGMEALPGGFVAQAVGTGPDVRHGITAQLFSRLIYEARRELIVSTPYFVPGETVCEALTSAAQSGVDVTLIVPSRNDSGFVSRASRSYYPRLIAAGVKIAEYRGGLLHAKTLTIDGATTFLGSSNMDIRSFDLNFENDILFSDPALTGKVRQRQMAYLAESTPVDPEAVRAWSVPRCIWFNAFAVVGPVL